MPMRWGRQVAVLFLACSGIAAAVGTLYAQAPADTVGTRAARPDSAIGGAVPIPDFKMHLSAYPYAYYTPETEFAFGAGGDRKSVV